MSRDASSSGAVARKRLDPLTGVVGLASTVLVLVPVIVGTPPEPAFTANATEFVTYYRSPNTVGSEFRSFVFTAGLVAFVWFTAALTTLLRRAEPDPPRRSAIAFGSALVFVALVLSGNEVAVALRANDIDPQIARYAFDEGQVTFANARVALGSFALSCGWVIVMTRFLPRWSGWVAVVSGAGLALSRIRWTSYVWLPFYLVFWLWVAAVSVTLLRRHPGAARPSA